MRRNAASLTKTILANVATLAVFRVGVGPEDSKRLAPWMRPTLSAYDLERMPDYHAAVRTLRAGRPIGPLVTRMDAPPPAISARAISAHMAVVAKGLVGGTREVGEAEQELLRRRERLQRGEVGD